MNQNIYKRWIIGVILFPLVLLFILVVSGFTQSSTNYQIKKFVFDQAGAASQSTKHIVVDAMGQPSPVGEATNTNYIVSSGFLGGGKPISSIDVAETGEVVIPDEFKLCQNYHNPFNPETSIKYNMPQTSEVVLTIYNLQGYEVRCLVQGTKLAGYHTVHWDGQNESGQKIASGLYLYRIKVKTHGSDRHTYIGSRKMLLMK
jgi:hypothetical protein